MVEPKPNEFVVPRRTLTPELLVGLFALIGVSCFAYLAINIARMKFLETGFYQITAEFDNIAGLDRGAPVEIAGVHVGEVTDITLKDTAAVVTLKIADDVQLRDDDMAAIRTKGIIGERYIKITPGGAASHISKGGKIADTQSAVEFEDIIGKIVHRME